ncbi:hypothetical protein [Streptomyces wedmorensis]
MSDFSDPDFEDGWTRQPPTDSTMTALSREIETLRAVCRSNKQAYIGAVKDAMAADERAKQAEATLNAVCELHQQYRFAGDDTTDYCAHCNQISGGWIPWPCPTTRLLDQHGQTPA